MQISSAERALGFLGYLPLLGMIIARYVRRDSMFVQFHARQGAVLFGLWFVLALIMTIALVPAGGGLGATILLGIIFAATFGYLVMMLIGMLKVLLGERYRMPVVADVALLLRL